MKRVAAEFSAKPALVMLLTRDPFTERSGRAAMLRQRIEQFSTRFRVVLAIAGPEPGAAFDGAVQRLAPPGLASVALNAVRLSGRPLQTWLCYTKDRREAVRGLVETLGASAIYIDMIRLAPLCEGLPDGVRRFLDYDDLLSERYRRAAGARNYPVLGFLAARAPLLAWLAGAFSRSLLKWEAQRCAAEELALLGGVDLALFTSKHEAALLAGRAEPSAAPPVFAVPPQVAPIRDRRRAVGRRLLFLGNLNYGENVQMLQAISQSLTELEAAGELAPDVMVEVVGQAPQAVMDRCRTSRLSFLGRIEDLGALAGAGVFLAPVTSGSGVKLKILDGMALGCPVVTTPLGLEGLQARADRDLLVRPTPTGMLRTAVALRDRTTLKAKLAGRGRDYLRRRHGPDIAEPMLAQAAYLASGAASPAPARSRTSATQSAPLKANTSGG